MWLFMTQDIGKALRFQQFLHKVILWQLGNSAFRNGNFLTAQWTRNFITWHLIACKACNAPQTISMYARQNSGVHECLWTYRTFSNVLELFQRNWRSSHIYGTRITLMPLMTNKRSLCSKNHYSQLRFTDCCPLGKGLTNGDRGYKPSWSSPSTYSMKHNLFWYIQTRIFRRTAQISGGRFLWQNWMKNDPHTLDK